MEFINEDTSMYPHTNATLFLTASSSFFAVVLFPHHLLKLPLLAVIEEAITTHSLRVTSITHIYMQGSGENNTEKYRAQVAKSIAYL